MKRQTVRFYVNIISFYELEEQWQTEAISNLDFDIAQEASYLEPNENHNPTEHVLFDLTECFPNTGTHKTFEYNATITISNNSGMLLYISDDGETASYIYV